VTTWPCLHQDVKHEDRGATGSLKQEQTICALFQSDQITINSIMSPSFQGLTPFLPPNQQYQI